MEARASAKYLRGSAQKARLVIDLIRGKNVNQALAILQFTNKRAADGIEKCVRSAIANASEAAEKANVAVDPDELWVKAAFVDKGPTKNRRRMRPAPQGRAYRERRHFCNVTILLSSDEKITAADLKKAAKAGDAKPAKLEENKARKRGGAVAAPRPKRTAPPKGDSEKKETKRATKKTETAEETATSEE
ncbi:MAG: large subunit ribosomal protein [Acidobacteriota bacterium]|jgi:large subunit ribosomal protein L22|nr:large subunit ribosomal protein [Acidobacteriota bacterium]